MDRGKIQTKARSPNGLDEESELRNTGIDEPREKQQAIIPEEGFGGRTDSRKLPGEDIPSFCAAGVTRVEEGPQRRLLPRTETR